jgi:2'-5' RNA ligase
MRLFLAVPLTDEARQALSSLVRERAGRGLPGRVVRPENWHLTLRFVGDVGEVERDRVSAALDGADLGPPFDLRWEGLGAFPRTRRAAVLWIGVERGRDAAEALAEAVAEALDGAGLPPEDRPFRAHLTLSRIRPHQDVSALLDAVEPFGITMPVDRVVLYRSHLGPGGARYEELDSFPLG